MYNRRIPCPECCAAGNNPSGPCSVCHGAREFYITHMKHEMRFSGAMETTLTLVTAGSPAGDPFSPLLDKLQGVMLNDIPVLAEDRAVALAASPEPEPEKKDPIKRDNADWDF